MKKLLLVFAFVTGISALASAQTGKAVRPESKTTATQPAVNNSFSNATEATKQVATAPAQEKPVATTRKTTKSKAKKN